MLLVDARVVLATELVLHTIHLVLVAPETKAALHATVLVSDDRDESSDNCDFADV